MYCLLVLKYLVKLLNFKLMWIFMRCLVRSTKLLISDLPWLLSTPHEMLKVFIDCVIISYTWLGSCINILQTKIDTIISDAVMKLNRKNDTKQTLKVSLNLIKISYKHLVLFEWRQSQSQIRFNELMMFDTARHRIVSAYLGGTLLLPWAKITVSGCRYYLLRLN